MTLHDGTEVRRQATRPSVGFKTVTHCLPGPSSHLVTIAPAPTPLSPINPLTGPPTAPSPDPSPASLRIIPSQAADSPFKREVRSHRTFIQSLQGSPRHSEMKPKRHDLRVLRDPPSTPHVSPPRQPHCPPCSTHPEAFALACVFPLPGIAFFSSHPAQAITYQRSLPREPYLKCQLAPAPPPFLALSVTAPHHSTLIICGLSLSPLDKTLHKGRTWAGLFAAVSPGLRTVPYHRCLINTC